MSALLIHKAVCMVRPNPFRQEIYAIIKIRLTEAVAWQCFPLQLSQHRPGLQKIKVLPHGLSWSTASSVSCCMKQLLLGAEHSAVTFREVCRSAFLQVAWHFLTQHLLYHAILKGNSTMLFCGISESGSKTKRLHFFLEG